MKDRLNKLHTNNLTKRLISYPVHFKADADNVIILVLLTLLNNGCYGHIHFLKEKKQPL